jgi:hypothetical protein
MTEGRKKRVRELTAEDRAQVRAAFAPYLKFRAALLRAGTDFLALFDLCGYVDETGFPCLDTVGRQDEVERALIVALSKIWREWQGTSPRTVGTDTSKLGAGKFPFGDWVVDLFKAVGESPPSRYAIHKAISHKAIRLKQ